MALINGNFLKLQNNYLFADIARKVAAFGQSNPNAKLIRMGIGDVTRPLPQVCIDAMHKAVNDLADSTTLHGYGPEQGYDFLRELIVKYDFNARGVDISADEVFVSDGAKSDTANIVDIFSDNIKIAITDPVYPVYVDSNVIEGRTGVYDGTYWSNITYLPCNSENGFVPSLPRDKVDLIYLCFPNNPTGTVLTKEQLKVWVDYALEHDSIILFDAAYEAFIREEGIPHSIYEIEGAKRCAVEFRSFSKTAGFTGVRCGYTVVPRELTGTTPSGERVHLNPMWNRRQTTKFNGASYITQRGAAAIYSPEGQRQVKEIIDYYLHNAATIRTTLTKMGYTLCGGVSAPYIWVRTPEGMSSWDFFDHLLNDLHIVGTPGVGFGPEGEGYFRLSSFNSHENTREAMERIRNKR